MNDEMFDLVRQSVTEHAMTEDERQLERLRVTCEKVLPPMRFLFRILGKPCFPRGELVAVTGKAKSGKTLFNSMLMACCATTQVLQVQRPPDSATEGAGPLRCMWYDTEQSEQSTQDILKNRILPMAGFRMDNGQWTMTESFEPLKPLEQLEPLKQLEPLEPTDLNDMFYVFNVRCLPCAERLRLFETAVLKYRPDLVVLDGVRDLLADINDGVKAQELMEHLMRLAQEADCCMVCVLHQNKGAEDRNLRGWIGTELMNKAFEVYACEKVKPENIFVVEQTHTRKYDLEGLLFFRMDAATGMPVVCEAPVRYAAEGNIQVQQKPGKKPLPPMNRDYLTFDENNHPHPKTEELFYEALKAGPLVYYDLQMRVMTLLNCGTGLWNNMFNKMRDEGYIVRRNGQGGNVVWMLSAKAAPAQPAEPDLFDQIAAEIEAVSLLP